MRALWSNLNTCLSHIIVLNAMQCALAGEREILEKQFKAKYVLYPR